MQDRTDSIWVISEEKDKQKNLHCSVRASIMDSFEGPFQPRALRISLASRHP